MTEQPQARQQHPVPQEVFGVQFKLVGDLTLRQFGLLAFFGLIAVAIFSSGIFLPIRIILTLIFGLGGVIFALIPIQDQPADQWISTFIRAIYSPTQRIWIKSGEPAEFLTVALPQITPSIEPGVTAQESRERLKEFLAVTRTEAQMTPLDLEENQSLQKINVLARQVTPPVAVAPTPPPAPAVVTTEEERPPLAVPSERVPAAPVEEEVAPLIPAPRILPELRFVEVQKMQQRPSLASRINWAENVYKVQRGETASYFAPRRNVRVGRRLTPIAVSGEMVYSPVRERVIEPVIPEAPPLSSIKPAFPVMPPTPEGVTQAVPSIYEEKPQKVPPTPPEVEAAPPAYTLPAPPEAKIIEEKAQPPAEMPPAPVEETKPQVPPTPPVEAPAEPKKPSPPVLASKPMPKLEAPKPVKLGDQPNVIFGTVHNPSGGALSNTLLVIKDVNGKVVRATKTNELGKFSAAPLAAGPYEIEILNAPFPFATIKIELTGEKMAEMDIRPTG